MRAVVEAYGKVEAASVEVAVNVAAVIVLYEVRLPRKSEVPRTSRMLPVVDVADAPRRRTLETVDG